MAKSVIDILTQACAVQQHRRHGVFVICCLMVHCRSPLGAWKHAHRSYLRGFSAYPHIFPGVDLPPPPPPPISFGVEFPVPHFRSKWVDLCDDEEKNLDTLEKDRPLGVVTYLVDAPLPAKDISLPITLCLSFLLEPSSATTPSVSTDDDITGDYLELPSTNGVILEQPSTNGENNILELPSTNGENILQALHDMKHELKVALEIERAAGKKSFKEAIGDLAVFKDEITDKIMAVVVDMLPTPAAIVRTEDDEVLAGPLDGSREMLVDGDCGKEQRAEEGHWDIDSIGNILQGIHTLRIYCFPMNWCTVTSLG